MGRKAPVESIAHVISPAPEVVAKPVARTAESHSEDLVAQLQLDQKETEDFKNMAKAPQLEPAQIQKLISQVQNSQYSFLLRRQAAVTLHRHLDESQWRDLISKMDTRLKEVIASNPRDLLEGYIRAAAR
ncbi:hypothetical protein D3C72_1977230 [compost metagenome]